MKKRASKRNIIEKFSTDGDLVYRIDKDAEKIEYFVQKDPRKNGFQISKIYFEGFDKLPKGFYTNGFGITSGSYLIRNKLYNTFKEDFTLVISDDKPSKILKSGKKYIVRFKYSDFEAFQNRIRAIKTQKNKENEAAADFFFNRFFPTHFEDDLNTDPSLYRENQIADILKKVDLLDNLSKLDNEALIKFIPEFMKIAGSHLRGSQKIIQLSKSKNETELVYLESVIQEFEKKLIKNVSENNWQTFLRDYILLFNTNYSSFIEKASISLSGKYPDFMLIDIYDFIDIYEIKKPATNLLKYDTSRDNYYWDVEIAKAISQVENYVDEITKNSLSFKDIIKRKKGIDVRIIKPRAFIIAGHSDQLDNPSKEENFRLLNSSFKNIEIILYDDLLASLKNFSNRLKGA